MLKVIIYTRFPQVIADLLESHYKRIVLPPAAKMIGPIQVSSMDVEFPYDYTDKFIDDPLETWMKWAINCGLIRSYKREKVELHPCKG